jgi:hypothetical protein
VKTKLKEAPMIMGKRNSGRTSIMLHRAVVGALEGQDVMVMAATHAQADQMFRRVAEMQTPTKAIHSRRTLEYGEGRLRFVVNTPDRINERGFSGRIMVDHYVFETLYPDLRQLEYRANPYMPPWDEKIGPKCTLNPPSR